MYEIYTAKAPVNIALIKYWGKENESLKIPINDSLSGTLDIDDMCATTSVALSESYQSDKLWLNGQEMSLSSGSLARILLDAIRAASNRETNLVANCKVHIVSYNDFPTAAGLASSAAGYACLAFVLGQAYGLTDPVYLSRLARQASGSACRSLFGGFVQWHKGRDHETSRAEQIVDHLYWPQMRVVICVVNDQKKETSSSEGMQKSVKTSELIHHRARHIVPSRMDALREAIYKRDFETFANITMKDSNQFHAICLDSYPPIFYINETSRQIIKICSMINAHYKRNMLAYTFDAGPNACIYLLDEFVNTFIAIMKSLFLIKEELSNKNDGPSTLDVRGKPEVSLSDDESREIKILIRLLEDAGLKPSYNAIKYLINTSIGDGPRLVQEHINDANLLV